MSPDRLSVTIAGVLLVVFYRLVLLAETFARRPRH